MNPNTTWAVYFFMDYQFLDYKLNSKTSELQTADQVVLLKQKQFLLLTCLLNNPQQILSKDFLLKEVWDNRLVSDNTISQTVSQLRQLIGDDGMNPKWIVTHRGRGISFTPAVTRIEAAAVDESIHASKQKSKYRFMQGVLFVILIFVGYLLVINLSAERNLPSEQVVTPPKLLIVQSGNASDVWLAKSITPMLIETFRQSYTGPVDTAKAETERSIEQYISQQWAINPNLNVLQADLTEDPSGFQITLNITDPQQLEKNQIFKAPTVGAAIDAATSWANNELGLAIRTEQLQGLFSADTAVVELYMRGLAAEGDLQYEKAAQYYDLVLLEEPQFHLARLHLANVKKYLGLNEEALQLLDVLAASNSYPYIELEAAEIRGYIYDVQGKFAAAKEMFESTLKKHAAQPAYKLNPIRFEFSYILGNLNEIETALEQLNLIVQTTNMETDPLLLADTLHKQGSLYLSLGKTAEAEVLANQSLSVYLKLGELLGAAKAHHLSSRVYTVKSDFIQAKHHLYQTIKICNDLNYRLGVGAALNELVYLLLREGAFDEAEPLIAEMQEIAIEIEYSHMLIGVKQHFAALAMARQEWQVAKQFIEQQQELAKSSQNKTAMITGYFLELEYFVESSDTEGADEVLSWLEENIQMEQTSRHQIDLLLRRAQINLLDGDRGDGIEWLIAAKGLATEAGNQEALVAINNTMATAYLQENPEKALQLAQENDALNALAYPHLLIKSKALKQTNQLELSLAAAIAAKNKSGQNWRREDEAYLSQLRQMLYN